MKITPARTSVNQSELRFALAKGDEGRERQDRDSELLVPEGGVVEHSHHGSASLAVVQRLCHG